MEEDKFKDLLEDEELTSLRLAALATKRKQQQKADNSSDSVCALPINSIVTASTTVSESVCNQIPFVQSDRNLYNNYSWRKQAQTSRRRGGAFPKNNHRSNLIVISPVPLNDGKDSEEKAPMLILPQHKWCNSGNEDSMSPKTLRRTGPTRFNRHGSDSESSDSDFENSDNDSGSNETVLQDEPPEHFSRLSPESDVVSDSVEKQRRLSFQNLESEIKSDAFEKNETTSVYNCLKNSSSSFDYTDNKSDNYVAVQNMNDGRHDWNHSVENEYNSYKQYNTGHTYSTEPLDPSEGFAGKQNSSSVLSNGESHINEASGVIAHSSDTSLWQNTGVKTSNSYYSRDISSVPENARNHGLSDRKSKDYADKRQSLQMCSEIQGPESSVWQHGERLRCSNSYYPRDTTYSTTISRNFNGDNNTKEQLLSGDDLRLELKKRMQEMQSKSSAIENSTEMIDHKTFGQSNTWDRNRQRYIHEEEKISDITCTNSYGNRQELSSNIQRNRHERSFSRDKDRGELSASLNRRRQRSLSRERNKQVSCSGRDITWFEYNFGPERGRYDRCSSLDRNKHEFTSSWGRKRHERSSSYGRSRHERSSSRDRSRHERSASHDRSKHERSSSRDRIRHERSSSRAKIRHERSSSRARSRRERSSSSARMKYESSAQDSNKHEHSSSQERDERENTFSRSRSHQEQNLNEEMGRHEHNFSRDQTRHELKFSQNRSRYTHSTSQDRSRHECRPSQNRSRSDRSSSQDSRHVHSSSSGSRHEHSLSRDRSRREYSSSRERSRHKHSRSRDRSRHGNSSSRDRSRHERSHSRKRSSREHSVSQESEHTPSRNRIRHEHSSSCDRTKHEHSSNQDGSDDEINSSQRIRHEHNSSGTKDIYKHSSSVSKSKLNVTLSQEKNGQECEISQENIGLEYSSLQIKKLECIQNSERVRDSKNFQKTSTKEQCETDKRNRVKRSRSKEKLRGEKRLFQRHNRMSDSNFEVHYSRSRSSSTTSCSTSSSSSSSHSSRPKIRSVPSVIKSFQSKSSDVDKKETFCEIKSAGKNINSVTQSDVNSISSKKASDVNDHNKLLNIKCGRVDGDSKASDSNKRVPVHMRLGALSRKRVIQMPKDVEAAFVNSSSSSDGENVNNKCKRQNIRIVTDIYGSKSGIDSEKKHSGKEKATKRSPDIYQEKSKRVKTHR